MWFSGLYPEPFRAGSRTRYSSVRAHAVSCRALNITPQCSLGSDRPQGQGPYAAVEGRQSRRTRGPSCGSMWVYWRSVSSGLLCPSHPATQRMAIILVSSSCPQSSSWVYMWRIRSAEATGNSARVSHPRRSMFKKNRTGGCLCGAVTYGFDPSSVISAHHCHCKDCQKSTGSGKATIVFIREKSLEIEGRIRYFTVTGTDGAHVSRGFCESCGSPLISFIEEKPDVMLIKAGSLDDSSWVKIDSSFWSSAACTWSPVDETVPSFFKNRK